MTVLDIVMRGFTIFGAWALISVVVSALGGPCLMWDGALACKF